MSLNIKARRKALGLSAEELAKLIGLQGTYIIAEIEKEEVPRCYSEHLRAADEILERLETDKETGTIDGMAIRLARVRKGLSHGKLGKMLGIGGASISRLELYNRCNPVNLTKVLKVLGMEGQETKFKSLKVPLRVGTPRLQQIKYKPGRTRPDTTAAEVAEARLLNISYGTYIAYKETGYLETFKKQQAKDRDKGKNIIESNLIGAGNMGRRRNSLDGSKLS